MPASTPSSPSTETFWVCAYSTTFRVSAILSSYDKCEPSIITDENPISTQLLHNSKLSPWSRCKQICGWSHPSSLAYSTAPWAIYRSNVWFAYLRAPLETCKITGDFVSAHAETIACICSILLKLNAGIAYFPSNALRNISEVFTNPSSLKLTAMSK